MTRVIGFALTVFVFFFSGLCAAVAAPIWFVTQGTGGSYTQNEGHLYTWDPATDTVTDRGRLNEGAWGDIAMTPSGELYGIKWENGVNGGGTRLYELTPGGAGTDASYTAVSEVVDDANLNSLGWADNGFWAVERGGKSLYRCENVGGTWTFSERNEDFDSGGDIELAPDGTLYAVSDGSNPSNLYSVDRTSGIPTDLGSLHDEAHIFFGIAFDGSTMFGFENDQGGYADGSDIYVIDPGTLTTSFRFDLGSVPCLADNVWGATSTPVPVPGAVWLLSSGLIGLVGIQRKFRA